MPTSRIRVGNSVNNSPKKTRGRGELAWAGKASPGSTRSGVRSLKRETASRNRAGENLFDIALAAPSMVVPDLSSLSLRKFLVLSGLGMGLVLVILGLVLSSHMAVSHSYDLSGLIQDKIRLVEVNRQLKTELARFSSLDQLEVVARETLSMVTPQQGQIVVIE